MGFTPFMQTIYQNNSLPSFAMFTVDNAPTEMIENIGKRVALRLRNGATNPHHVTVEGIEVMPKWEKTGRIIANLAESVPTKEPRVYVIAGLQKVAGRILYRIHQACGTDMMGVAVDCEEIIFL